MDKNKVQYYVELLNKYEDRYIEIRDLIEYELAREMEIPLELLSRAISASKGQSSVGFIKEYIKNINQPERSEAKRYSIFLPLTVDVKLNLPYVFHINDHEMTIIDMINSRPSDQAVLSQISSSEFPPHIKFNHLGKFLKIRSNRKKRFISQDLALDDAIKSLNIFRYAYEFNIASIEGLYIDAHPSVLASFHFPNWAYCLPWQEKQGQLTWYIKGQFDYFSTPINDDQMKIIKRFIQSMKVKSSDEDKRKYIHFIIDCLSLYCNARESTESSLAHLGYWQCLERISLNENGDSKLTIDRICLVLNHFGLRYPFRKYLNDAMRIRNTFAHKGVYDNNFSFRSLAWICRQCISFFYIGRKHFSSIKEIEDMYKWAAVNEEEFCRQQNIVDKISKIRSKTYTSRR